MLCALGYLWSSGYVTQKNTHIRITAVYDLLPPKTRLLLDLFSVIFGFVVIALLLYAAWGKGIRALSVWERTGSSWDPPLYAIVKPAIILGAGFFCLQLFSNFVKLVRRYRELADNAPRPNSSPNQK
jgi:TRAP-type mannitol/chloroaromatic compound transport system permease small subunit